MLNWLKRKFTKSENPEPETGTVQIGTLERCTQLKEQGNQFLTEGRLKEAEKCYRQAISIDPNYAHAHNNLSHVLKQQGLIEQAQKSAQTALSLDPNLFGALYQLGTLARDQAQMEGALNYFNRALGIRPDFEAVYDDLFAIYFGMENFEEAQKINDTARNTFPESAKFHYNAGLLCARQNEFEQAIICLQQALQFDCDNIEIISLLGRVFASHGDAAAALAHQLRAYQLQPDSIEISDQLASAYILNQRLDEAVNCYERILLSHPDLEKIHHHLGLALRSLKLYKKAELSFRTAIKIKPDFALAYCDLASVLNLMGEFDAAEFNAKKAIELNKELEIAYFYLGNAMHSLLKHDEAIQSYQRAIEIKPDYADAYCNIGVIYSELNNFEATHTWFQRTLECDPLNPGALFNLGILISSFSPASSLPYFRRLIQSNPNNDSGYNGLFFNLSHCEDVSADDLFDEHISFANQFESPELWPEHHNSRDPSRQLQIGFVSGDLRTHAVMKFFEPILACLAQYPDLSLHAYNTHHTLAKEDEVTRRVKKYFQHWHNIPTLLDSNLCKKIMDDKIDILVDLSGHTAGNRLRTFALKPAPVQITWIGYPGTTGLQAMDYLFSDKYFTPDGMLASRFTEKLVCLPSTPNFSPQKNTPDVNLLPALSNGYITFGSFNRLNKLNASVIALWAQLLRAIPTSRLLVYGTKEGRPNPIIQWFENEGIDMDRIIFYPNGDTANYLASHNKVDICLDSFPYTGGTTTKDALMMGIPTLTLPGTTPVSRMGAAILGAVDLTAFIATDKEDFVKKGVAWSANISELARIRADMRTHCASFSNQNPEQIAASIVQAFRIMWQRWCDGLPAIAFDAETEK